MLAATTIAAIGLTVSAVSAAGGVYSAVSATQASQRAERLRRQQLRSETARRQREVIRQSMVANSLTRARAVNQGAGLGSSAVEGSYGQTAGEVGRQSTGLFENLRIGEGIFEANASRAFWQGMNSTFQQAGNLGNMLMSRAQDIHNIGTTMIHGTDTSPNSGALGPRTSSWGAYNPWAPTVNPVMTGARALQLGRMHGFGNPYQIPEGY